MVLSTAVMHNSNMLVALNGERPFLTRGSAGGGVGQLGAQLHITSRDSGQ